MCRWLAHLDGYRANRSLRCALARRSRFFAHPVRGRCYTAPPPFPRRRTPCVSSSWQPPPGRTRVKWVLARARPKGNVTAVKQPPIVSVWPLLLGLSAALVCCVWCVVEIAREIRAADSAARGMSAGIAIISPPNRQTFFCIALRLYLYEVQPAGPIRPTRGPAGAAAHGGPGSVHGSGGIDLRIAAGGQVRGADAM